MSDMKQYIDKFAVVAEIEKRITNINDYCVREGHDRRFDVVPEQLSHILSFLDTLKVTTQNSNTNEALEKFKTLQHITGDKKSTVEDWAYTPNLYHFDGSWHVDWISCEEGDSLIGFSAETPEEAIDKAYDWFHSTFCNG